MTTVGDLDHLGALAAGGRTDGLDSCNNVHALGDLAEDDVLAIEMGGGHGGHEELGAVSIGPGIGHGQKPGLVVTKSELLVFELAAVDGLTATAGPLGEVATLEHELGDYAVEYAVLVVQRLARLPHALLAGAESAEVLGSAGNDVGT